MRYPAFLVDASVAVKWFTRREDEADVLLAERLIASDIALSTTTLAQFEVSNALLKKDPGSSAAIPRAMAALLDICGTPVPLTEADFSVAAEVARENGLTFYDASYVAISERLGRRVVSADRDLLDPGLAVDLETALASV